MGFSLSHVIRTVVRVVTTTVCGLLTLMASAHAQSLSLREYQIKAAFLYNFVKFVDWPSQTLPDTSDTLTICVLGEDPFGEALDSLKDKPAKGKRLAIRRAASVREVAGCHVLFVGSSEEKQLPQVIESAQQSHILTVGEMDQFAQRGGIINFVVERNKLRFEVSVDGAARAGLKISSQLLSLAKVVRQ